MANDLPYNYNLNKSTLLNESIGRNSLATDKPVAHEFPIELEFRSVGFCGGRKTVEKSSEQNTQILNPHMTPGPGIEPGPHWWEASAFDSPLRYP